MGKDNLIIGMEIGTAKVCVVVGELRHDGAVRILGVGQAPSRGVRKGEITDFETASKCVYDALVDAEAKADVEIGSVFLAISGAHISSFNNRGMVAVPEEREEIDESDLEAVQIAARDVALPQPNAFVHTIPQHYYIDGQEGVRNPLGLVGRQLEANFHIIHGVGSRIKNSVRLVKELDILVEDIVFAPLAAAQVALTPEQKNLGALLLDIGGGTTDYILYVDGAVKQSGVLAVGGDHITNDISMGLRIPMSKAERIKVEEGDCTLGTCLPGETIYLKDDTGFAGKEVEREMLNTIIHARVSETLELLKRQIRQENYLDYLGAGIFLTGGCSQLRGLPALVEEVFGLPVRQCRPQSLSGPTAASENPQFSAAIGLIRFAQAIRPVRRGFFDRLKTKFPRFLSLLIGIFLFRFLR